MSHSICRLSGAVGEVRLEAEGRLDITARSRGARLSGSTPRLPIWRRSDRSLESTGSRPVSVHGLRTAAAGRFGSGLRTGRCPARRAFPGAQRRPELGASSRPTRSSPSKRSGPDLSVFTTAGRNRSTAGAVSGPRTVCSSAERSCDRGGGAAGSARQGWGYDWTGRSVASRALSGAEIDLRLESVAAARVSGPLAGKGIPARDRSRSRGTWST